MEAGGFTFRALCGLQWLAGGGREDIVEISTKKARQSSEFGILVEISTKKNRSEQNLENFR
jgi:hypothetical protein